MRAVSREANSVSAVDPTSSAARTMLNSRSNARLRSAVIELVVSSTSTAPRTLSPTQIGCAAVTITARPSGVVRRSTVRMPASAPVTSRASPSVRPAASSSKSSVGCCSTWR
jgi:hypothetical protein